MEILTNQAASIGQGASLSNEQAREAYMKQTVADMLRELETDYMKNLAKIDKALHMLPTRTLNMTRRELEAAGLCFEPWRLLSSMVEAERAEQARRAEGVHPTPAGLTD